MVEERKVQLGFAVDATGVKPGLDSIKQGVDKLAQDVQSAGEKASKGIDAIGKGAPEASRKVDAATKSIIGSIQRTTALMEAGERGSAKYYEALAAQRGVSADALKPYLAQLDAVNAKQAAASKSMLAGSASLDKVGVSAAQTAAALRGVPAQFTDIVTSLQGGQAPMTVLLQQGGQLKDMFGGAGNAAKALGGYVLGLINPFTVAAAAAVGLGYAMYSGAEQQRAFRSALILSGNAAGATASQIEEAYARVAKATGQNGASEEAIIALVKGRQVAVEQLEATAAAVVRFSRAAGVEAKTLVEDFNGIGKDPVKAVLTLQEKYGILTAATYQQAAALAEQGKKQEAVTLVMGEAGKAMDEIGAKAKENKGSIEAFWDSLKSGASGIWQGAMDLGKEATPEQNLLKQQALLQSLQGRSGTARSWELPGLAEQITATKAQILSLETLIDAQKAYAKAQGEANEVNDRATAGIAKINAGYESHLSKTQQLTKALDDLKRARDDAIKGPGVDVTEVNRKYASEVENIKRQLAPSFDMASLMHSLYIQESGNRQFRDDGSVVRNAGSGATGIAQIVPKYGPDYARMAGADWSEELLKTSADYGKKLAEAGIKTYLKMFDNDLEKALSAYNAGPGTVRKAVAAAGPDGDWKAAMRQFQSANNFAETQNYRAGILGRLPKDSAGDYGAALGAAPESAFDKQMIELRKRLADATAQADAAQRGLTKSQAEFEKIQASPAWAAYNAGQKSSIELMYQQADVQERIKKSAEDGGKIKAQADAQEAMNAAYGQSKIAVEQWKSAQLGANAAIAEALGQSPQLVAQLKKTAEEQLRYVDALKEAENIKFNERSDELLRSAKEQAKLYEDEAKLSGLTALERAKIVAQRQIELKYAKEIAEVNKSGLSDDQKTAQILKLNEARQIESSAAVAKVVQDDWAKTSEQINQSLTDALMRGFESGKGFGQNLRDTLVNLFKTLVLRPTIQAIMAPVSGSINSGLNAAGLGGSGGSGGGMNLVSTASNLYSAGSSAFTVGSQVIGGTMSIANAAGTIAANATGTGISGLLATNGAYGTAAGAAGATGAGAASGTFLGMGPAGWMALAAIAAYTILSQKGDSRFGSQGSYSATGGTLSNGGPNGANDDFGGVSAANKLAAQGIDKLLETVGSKERLRYLAGGFESSEKGKGFSYAGGILSNGKTFGQGTDGLGYQNNRGSMSPEQAQASYITELKQATLQSLQAATDIPKNIADQLKGVDIDALSGQALDGLLASIDKVITETEALQAAFNALPLANLKNLSFDAAAGLAAAAGGADKLAAGLGYYYENFYSEAERSAIATQQMTAEFAKLGIAVPENEAAFRSLLESIDVTTPAGQQLAVSVGALAPAFMGAANAARAAAASMLSALQNYGTELEVRDFQVSEIQKNLSAGGVNLSRDQIANASRADARAYYEQLLSQGNTKGAQAIFDQQGAFAAITQAKNSSAAGNDAYGGYGGGSGGGGGGGSGDSAATSIASAWQSITDSIWDEVKRIRGLLTDAGADGFAAVQAKFAITNAQARAGDQDAAKLLPELSKNLLTLAEGNVGTMLDLQRIQDQTAATLAQTGTALAGKYGLKVPAFASGGTHSGGWAMVGEQGPELAYMPPARIYTASDTRAMTSGQDSGAVVTELREQNRLLTALLAASQKTEKNTGQTADTLKMVTRDGEAMQTEAA